MKITITKISLLLFTILLFKKILFLNWEFQKVELNSLELLTMVISFGIIFYNWVITNIKNSIIKKSLTILSIAFSILFLFKKIPTNNQIIEKIKLSENKEIHIIQLDRSICLGNIEHCRDSIKVTKYKILQKREAL